MVNFAEQLVKEGYVFDEEDFDCCYVKQDANGDYHLYQEGEDEGEWNYVKMSKLFTVLKEQTFTIWNYYQIINTWSCVKTFSLILNGI